VAGGRGLHDPAAAQEFEHQAPEAVEAVGEAVVAVGEEVEVEVHPIPGGLYVEVVDHGVGIGDPVPFKPDHFGLRFVDTQSDRWGFRNDPTRVWFEVDGGSL